MKVLFLWIALSTGLLFSHPLDDLKEAELVKTISVIRQSGKFSQDVRFPTVMTLEPDKKLWNQPERSLARKEDVVPRRAFANVFEKKKNQFYELIVNLDNSTVESTKEIKGTQPPILMEEYDKANAIIKADPQWQNAMKKRNIKPEDAFVDAWAPGLLSPEERKKGARLMRGLTYSLAKGPLYYTRPVEGVVVTVDMNAEKVVGFRDTGVVPVAEGIHDFSKLAGPPLKPLIISQPKGASYQLKGQLVEWGNWSFRYSFQVMKGLVLYEVKYKDEGKPRSILSKASLSEMLVPYGDKDPNWAFRNAFDVGEYGLARSAAHTLELGKDVPENAELLDAVFVDDGGGIIKFPSAIGLYERDGGLLWKHMDQNTRKADLKRARELVITYTTTIGNYDYGVSWIFKEDASLELELHLTGVLLAKGTELEKNPCEQECKHLVEKNILAPSHQHFFAFRLDFDVDGVENTPVEVDALAIPLGKNNPFANAFESVLKPIKNETESGRDFNFQASRKWKVISKNTKNSLGHPTGYLLMPGENASPYLNSASPIRKRGTFVDHPVWFTRYHAEEQGAGGEYPNQHPGGDGVKKFASNQESLEGQDVVMWYVVGVTHLPRPEDWPVMPVHRAGFKLVPVNFFAHNPTVMVP